MDIRVTETTAEDLTALWNIVSQYPSYFDDTADIKTEKEFKRWFTRNVRLSLTGRKDKQIIGCGYIDMLVNSVGRINIFLKKKSMSPSLSLSVTENSLEYFFKQKDIGMLYAIVRRNNRACLALIKKLGFKISEVLKDFETIDGLKVDCLLATKMGGKT